MDNIIVNYKVILHFSVKCQKGKSCSMVDLEHPKKESKKNNRMPLLLIIINLSIFQCRPTSSSYFNAILLAIFQFYNFGSHLNLKRTMSPWPSTNKHFLCIKKSHRNMIPLRTLHRKIIIIIIIIIIIVIIINTPPVSLFYFKYIIQFFFTFFNILLII